MFQQGRGEHSMMKSSVSEWHRQFKEGQEDVHDDAKSGQPKKAKYRGKSGQSANPCMLMLVFFFFFGSQGE